MDDICGPASSSPRGRSERGEIWITPASRVCGLRRVAEPTSPFLRTRTRTVERCCTTRGGASRRSGPFVDAMPPGRAPARRHPAGHRTVLSVIRKHIQRARN